MAKWLDIKGPVVADTVYADSTLVAKDVAFTLPGIEFFKPLTCRPWVT